MGFRFNSLQHGVTMSKAINLHDFQLRGLEQVKDRRRCAFFWAMGLGKTFVGSEKLMSFPNEVKLIVCQKSKVEDWLEHMTTYYDTPVFDLTNNKNLHKFVDGSGSRVGIINYDLLWRRVRLYQLKDIAVCFDESSMIKRSHARRTQAALRLNITSCVLLSGTPTGGQYENLWSQCRLLGWRMSEDAFLDRYVVYRDFFPPNLKWPVSIVAGYKRTDEMLQRMRDNGANFLKTEEVLTLPEQVFTTVNVPQTKEYIKFIKDKVVEIDGREMVADNILTKLAYARQLCSGYSKPKEDALKDLFDSTNERVVVFYNFNNELDAIKRCAGDRPVSVINGKTRDLRAYEECDDSITIVNFQAGAKGLNLQKACRMIIYSPTQIAEDYMQSLKRIHRIGQTRTCFYYKLITVASVETHMYKVLATKQDYTLKMFAKDFLDV